MLERLNGYHAAFNDIFGDSYKRISPVDPIDLSRCESNTAISILLYLYLCRSDLQAAYPEVGSGDLSRLIDWGFNVAVGSRRDIDQPILRAYIGHLKMLREKPQGALG